MNNTGKLIQCIHRIASGCFRSSRSVNTGAELSSTVSISQG